MEENGGKETSLVISEEVKGTVITLTAKEILPTYFGHSRSCLDITFNTAIGRRTFSF